MTTEQEPLEAGRLQRLLEQALALPAEDRELIFQGLSRFSRELVLCFDAAGVLRHVSANCQAQLGCSAAELLAEPGRLEALVHPDDLALWHERHLDPGHEPFEVRLLAASGQREWFEHYCRPLTDVSGAPLGRIGTFLNVSQRRRGAEELEARNTELQRLVTQVECIKREWESSLDCIDQVIVLVDVAGVICRINRAVTRLYGQEPAALVGQPLAAFLPAAVVDTVLNYGSGEFFDDRLQRWFAWQSVPLATQQLVTRRAELVVTLHDVTELRHVTTELAEAYASQQQTQTQLVQQEKLATIGQMAAGVAHEINNPVGFIKSNLGTLAKYAGRLRGYIDQLEQLLRQTGDAAALSGLQEARRQHKVTGALEDIDDLIAESLDGAGRVQVIVQNLKSFSRVDDAGFQWTDLHECLESSLNIAWNEIKYRARVERDYAELPPLYCCPQQLNQVFLNLLVNAAQAIAEQGLIELRTRQEGDFLVVEIEDSGCGMAPEVIECIFDPFYTTKPAGEGSGLGLSICSDIVQKHHGELRVRSVVGRGSCFSVRLPLTAGEGADAADRPAPAASYARRLQGAVKPRSGPIGR